MSAALPITLCNRLRGQTALILPVKFPRNSNMSPSSGVSRAVVGSIDTGASGKPVSQPVTVARS